jgi:hypothetical protein
VRIAWNGEPLAVTAPWGESHVPAGVPLVRAGRAVAYSPFQAPREASPAFVAWQVARALERAYITRVPWQEIRERYLVERSDASVGVAEGGLTYRRDHAGVRARGSGPALPFVLLLGVAPFFLLLAVLLRHFRAGVSDRRRMIAFYVVLALPLALWLAPFVAGISRLAWGGVASGGYVAMAAAWTGESAVRTVGLWVMSGLVLAASYLVAEARFRRMEISGQPLKLTLLDWSADTG